jgi:hypothetical protein
MIDHSNAQASENLDLALATSRGFPHNPFLGRWDAFQFFDPDRLFERAFPDTMRALLACENGRSVCLRNMDVARVADSSESPSFYLDRDTTGSAYMGCLSSRPGYGWLYRMDVYAFASDAGQWCIYCERCNEMAVIAIRENSPKFGSALERLRAMPIRRAIESSDMYGFYSLPDEWRQELFRAFPPKE